MNSKIAILVLLLYIGAASALWVYADKNEYMPMDIIHLTVSDAKGTILVDVFDGNGKNVYHATRAAQHGQTDSWGYTYYYPEEFNFSLKSGEYDVRVKDDFDSANTSFEVTSIGIAAIIDKAGTGVFLHKIDGSAIEGGENNPLL